MKFLLQEVTFKRNKSLSKLFNYFRRTFNLDEKIRNLTKGGIFSRIQILSSIGSKMIDVLFNGEKIFSYNFQITPNSVIYEQNFPFEWGDFNEGPKFLSLFYADEQLEASQELFLGVQHNIVQLMEFFGVERNLLDIFPPFASTGLITSNNLIRTFDGKMIEVHENGEYLLMADFEEGSFTVSALYLNHKFDKITVDLNGQTIELNKDKLTLNKWTIPTPYVIGTTKISRNGHIVTIDAGTKYGFIVRCNGLYNDCTVKVTGSYFAKTGGLLGIYDNEPYNDLTNPQRQIVSENEFVMSWKLHSVDEMSDISTETIQTNLTCEYLFNNDNSPLMPCFDTVDPTQFLNQCSTDKCGLAASYIELCRMKNIELWMPSECVYCNDNVMQGESTQTVIDGKTFDIVFVADDKDNLPQMMKFMKSNFNGTRFALILQGQLVTLPGEFDAFSSDVDRFER